MYSGHSKQESAERLERMRRQSIVNNAKLRMTGTSEHALRRLALVEQIERASHPFGYLSALVPTHPTSVRVMPTYQEDRPPHSQAVDILPRTLTEQQGFNSVYRHAQQPKKVIIVKRSVGPEPWNMYQNIGTETWRRHYRVAPQKLRQDLQYGAIRNIANPGFSTIHFRTDRIEHGTTTVYDAVTPPHSNRQNSRLQHQKQIVPLSSYVNMEGQTDPIHGNFTHQLHGRQGTQRTTLQSSVVASDVVNRRKRKFSDFHEDSENQNNASAPNPIHTMAHKSSDEKHGEKIHIMKQHSDDDDLNRSKSPASLQISHEPLIHHTNKKISGFGKLDLLCSATLEMGEMYDNPSGCSCPKSRCIALYCDCFKAGRRCNPDKCKCADCKNTIKESGANGARTRAIQSILERNPRAFTTAGMGNPISKLSPGEIACNCVRSRCLKLYCTCFQVGVVCNPQICSCVGCHNTEIDEGGRRRNAMEQYLEKRPDAFTEKKPKQTGLGCACKNNRCIRKYCECYRTGLSCSAKCCCRKCENGKVRDLTKNNSVFLPVVKDSPALVLEEEDDDVTEQLEVKLIDNATASV